MITLGWLVRDVITGFEGIATARVTNLDGGTYILVTPAADYARDYPKEEQIAEYRLEKVDNGIAKLKQRKPELGFAVAIKEAKNE